MSTKTTMLLSGKLNTRRDISDLQPEKIKLWKGSKHERFNQLTNQGKGKVWSYTNYKTLEEEWL